ncbi:hypothetical protein [Halobacillus sp. Cin3]|uniref:hypothetical protein n=1 Tax=Halobacillus sp. Cin3 TaxID=2928441 RepID=UPI00248E72BF|nr:hypothetical protein [Halobacillus sp. Cin3]
MPRKRKSQKLIDKKYYTDFNMNPIELRKDEDGNYFESALKQHKRQYESLLNIHNKNLKKQKTLYSNLEEIEGNPNSRFNKLMEREGKDDEELHKLSYYVIEIEDIRNQLYPLERNIRSTERRLRAVYPTERMEIVYQALGEEMKGVENQ